MIEVSEDWYAKEFDRTPVHALNFSIDQQNDYWRRTTHYSLDWKYNVYLFHHKTDKPS